MSIVSTTQEKASTTIFLQTAENIGKKFAKEAIWSPEGRCNWQGASLEVVKGEYKIAQRTFKADLYNGLSGIALFLSELQAQTNHPIYAQILHGCINNIIHQHETMPLPTYFSFFGGQLGVGYTLWRVGKRLNNEAWKTKGLEIIASLEDKELADGEIDIITGAAGAVPILLGIYQQEKTPSFLKMAIKCGHFLIKKAIKNENAWSWESVGAKGLTGYSHGSAGIANALLDLFITTGDQQFKVGAMKGFQFERNHYNPYLKNWPDLRTDVVATQKQPVCQSMWCHGAPGMVLSRIKAYQQTNDISFFEEAKNALETTYHSVTMGIQQPQDTNFSLCHGLAGNADILLAAGHALNYLPYQQMAEQVGHLGHELFDKTNTDWPSGINDPSNQTSGRLPTPGLMLGLAGTGYFYLRLANPSIPSMLLL